jgi:uncharacterized protein (DUF736 family)
MALIGTFTKNEDGVYTGSIKTLTVNIKAAEFRPVEKTNANSPDYRVFAGDIQIGSARVKSSKGNRSYLSVTLDDPSFANTIFAALLESDKGHNLVWSRPRKVAA